MAFVSNVPLNPHSFNHLVIHSIYHLQCVNLMLRQLLECNFPGNKILLDDKLIYNILIGLMKRIHLFTTIS